MDKDYLKNLFRDLFKPKNKSTTNIIFLVFTLGILLLVLGSSVSNNNYLKGEVNNEEIIDFLSDEKDIGLGLERKESELERQLASILSKVEGAGEVEVLITYATTEGKIVLENTKTSTFSNGDEKKIDEEITAVIMEGTGGDMSPYVLIEEAPKVEGIIIIAQGGDNKVVCQALHSGVQAIFDVEAHKIAILKMN